MIFDRWSPRKRNKYKCAGMLKPANMSLIDWWRLLFCFFNGAYTPMEISPRGKE